MLDHHDPKIVGFVKALLCHRLDHEEKNRYQIHQCLAINALLDLVCCETDKILQDEISAGRFESRTAYEPIGSWMFELDFWSRLKPHVLRIGVNGS